MIHSRLHHVIMCNIIGPIFSVIIAISLDISINKCICLQLDSCFYDEKFSEFIYYYYLRWGYFPNKNSRYKTIPYYIIITIEFFFPPEPRA
jgi:hypothetical protein